MHLEQYDRIRERIASEGFTQSMETRIALFMLASKAVNLPFLASGGIAPATSVVWQAMNTHFFRESEALTLLTRVTRWSMDPTLYFSNSQLTAPLYAECVRSGFKGWSAHGENAGLEAQAMAHALLATVRMSPVIPESEAAYPFAVALMRIEQENGRLLQTQIRILKDGFTSVPIEEREAVISEKSAIVSAAFNKFLNSLIG